MMYKRYYSYNDMPQPIKPKPNIPNKPKPAPCEKKPVQKPYDEINIPFLGNLEIDDVVLMAVILLLLIDGCDDWILLFALAFIFLSKD